MQSPQATRVVQHMDLAVALPYQRPEGDEAWFITGGQRGVDVIAAKKACWAWPWGYHHLWLPALRYAQDEVQQLVLDARDFIAAHGGRLVVHTCMPGTDYRHRDLCMLQQAYDLQTYIGEPASHGAYVTVLAYPLFPEEDSRSRRSGTWVTCRFARKAGFPVTLCPLWDLKPLAVR